MTGQYIRCTRFPMITKEVIIFVDKIESITVDNVGHTDDHPGDLFVTSVRTTSGNIYRVAQSMDEVLLLIKNALKN